MAKKSLKDFAKSFGAELQGATSEVQSPTTKVQSPKTEVPKTTSVDSLRAKYLNPTKNTVTSVARKMILEGKSNGEVWAVLAQDFKLDEKKKSYPAWYRCEMVRKGLVKK